MKLELRSHFGFEKETFKVSSVEEALEIMKCFQDDLEITFKLFDNENKDITKQLRQ